jgi:hypothetical protein
MSRIILATYVIAPIVAPAAAVAIIVFFRLHLLPLQLISLTSYQRPNLIINADSGLDLRRLTDFFVVFFFARFVVFFCVFFVARFVVFFCVLIALGDVLQTQNSGTDLAINLILCNEI